MSKHTPGPWRVERDAEIGPDSPYFWPCIVSDHGEVVGTEGFFGDIERNLADAALAAAAPDLLEALQDLLQTLEFTGWAYSSLAPARAAIAKATGGEP